MLLKFSFLSRNTLSRKHISKADVNKLQTSYCTMCKLPAVFGTTSGLSYNNNQLHTCTTYNQA